MPRLYTTYSFWGLADSTLSRMGRVISVTLLFHLCWGGIQDENFLFGLVREFQRCFCDRHYSAIKKGGSQRSSNWSPKTLFETLYFDTFFSNASTVVNSMIFLSWRNLVIYWNLHSSLYFYVYFVRFQLPRSITSFLSCFFYSHYIIHSAA